MEEGQPQRRFSSRKDEEPAQPRTSPRQHGTVRRSADEQRARAEKDLLIKEACVQLAKHPEWLDLDEAIEEVNSNQLRIGKLSAAANCYAFGKKRYTALMAGRKLTFVRCITCEKVFNGLSQGSKHKCQPAGAPQRVRRRQSQPLENLRGGVQLATHLLHQVSTLILMCWWACDISLRWMQQLSCNTAGMSLRRSPSFKE